jgi:hypothetical protein
MPTVGTFAYGEVAYTLIDLLVASCDVVDDTYGTPESVPAGRSVEVSFEHDNNVMPGYGRIVRRNSIEKSASLSIGAGGVPHAALAIMMGASIGESGSTPNRLRTMHTVAGGAGMPYFGMIAVAATDDGGVFVVALRACMLNARPTINIDGENNTFVMSDAEAAGDAPFTDGIIAISRSYESLDDWLTVSPEDGTEFKALFTPVPEPE